MDHMAKLRWKCGDYGKPLLVLWYIFNIAGCLFFGLMHQAGVMPAVKYIGQDLQFKPETLEANFVWSHTYMPPTFELLRMSEKSRRLKKDKDHFSDYFLHPNIR